MKNSDYQKFFSALCVLLGYAFFLWGVWMAFPYLAREDVVAAASLLTLAGLSLFIGVKSQRIYFMEKGER